MESHVYVLYLLARSLLIGNADGISVFPENNRWLRLVASDLAQQTTQPDCLLNGVCNSHVLGFGRRAGDARLLLSTLHQCSIAHEHDDASGGPALFIFSV